MAGSVNDYDISEDAKNLLLGLNRVLGTVVAAFEKYNVPLPTRRYWMLGEPALDCEQVVVSFNQVYLGRPGDEATQPRHCNDPRSMVVDISVVRKAAALKNGGVPSGEAIQSSSEWGAIDAWVLLESMQDFDYWNDGMPGMGVIATVNARAPEGAYQQVIMSLTIAVP